MFRRILVALVLASFAASTIRADEYRSDRTHFTDFLFATGEKLDCYFTLETWEPWDSHPSCFKDVKILDEKPASIDALVAKLKREIPGITVTHDPANSRILHLIDASLLKQSHYVLETQASIDFSGPLEDLPNSLGKRMWYAVRRSEPTGGDFQNDVVSMVDLHFARKAIRQILTDAVPLKKYGRVLWIAKTRLYRDGRLGTEITYIGAKQVTAAGRNEGAVVEISIPAECTLGRPMLITVVIRNTSDKPFCCDSVAGLPNDKMEMKLENRDTKTPVAMSARGMIYMESVKRGGQAGIERLEKGKWMSRTIDLAEFFPITAGHYAFTGSFVLHREPDWHDIPVVVNGLDFTVAK